MATKRILVVNGPNLNMLGVREPEVYGKRDYKSLLRFIKDSAKTLGVRVKIVQSNCEGALVTVVQKAYGKYDGLVINAGGYTHTSVALADAIKAVAIPTVEVHLSDIYSREPFRAHSYITPCAVKTVTGKGFEGYKEALEELMKKGS